MRVSRAQGVILLAGFMTYVVMGAFVFEILEKDHNKKVIDRVFHLKHDFLLNYTALSPEEVELFIQKLIRSVRKGIIPAATHPSEKYSNWDFANSFFFVGTMLATIGYGNVSPQTKEGQIFCIIFALFGIPFNLICLNYIGFLVSRLFESCARNAFGKGKKKTARYIFVFVVVGIVMFLILPSFLFQWMEGWTFYEAVYFTFITLSTIGFGDYLIGRNHERSYFVGYQLLAAIWIVIGLAWIAVLFELFSSLLAPADPKAALQKMSKMQR
ncbi:potassium channel subfamily K member 16-like isoform X1 [Podarcis raffonei]|uniref:potassium channel subfamily K member 16-like isoform X1 n=1 Tax=Podarcis raffonei TaxID=65483 RepID=UPI0023297238|nr:potassium channel subfamily K member 16-like isoform X1 [Podarcis raffonei]